MSRIVHLDFHLIHSNFGIQKVIHNIVTYKTGFKKITVHNLSDF